MAEINKEQEQVKRKKQSFFKDLIKSIKDFDKYEDFALEGMGKTATYLLKITLIFTLAVVILSIYQFSKTLNNAVTVFNKNIESMTYENGELTINNNEELELDGDIEVFGNILINTSENLTEEQTQKYEEMLDNTTNGIVILRNKALIKNEMASRIIESNYSELANEYQISTFNKDDVLNYFMTNQFRIYATIFIIMYIYMFVIYLSSVLIDCLVLAALGYILARILKMRIKFSATFSMGVHALTLSIILNIIYVIVNGLTGFTIKYFQIMYTVISYIYIIAALLIIKSDYVKRRLELEKIQNEQEKVKAELEMQKRKDEDKQADEKREKEKQEQKDKEQKNNDNESKDKNDNNDENGNSSNAGQEPNGSNA